MMATFLNISSTAAESEPTFTRGFLVGLVIATIVIWTLFRYPTIKVCDECSHTFDNDKRLNVCPECGGPICTEARDRPIDRITEFNKGDSS